MRRKIAMLLCALLCITAFTGCSTTELGLLKMGSDIISTAKAADFSGTVKIDLDADELKTFATKIATEAGLDAETAAMTTDSMTTLTGKKSATLDYSMSMDMNSLDYKMAFKLKYDGKSYDLGDMYFSMTKGYYVSGKTLAGVLELAATTDMANQFPAEMLAELTKELGSVGYVQLISPEEMGMTEEQMAMYMPDSSFQSMYTAALKFYEDAFSGFTTGAVTKTTNGYKIEADGHAVAALVISLLDYIGSNPDTVLGAFAEYMTVILDSMNLSEEEKASANASFDEMLGVTSELTGMMAYAKSYMEELVAMPATQTVLDGLKYESTIEKSGSAYTFVENISIKNGSKNVMSITATGNMKASTATMKMPTTSISIDALTEKVMPIVDKYNETTSVNVSWDVDSNGVGYYYTETTIPYFNNNYGEINYLNQDGRIYLPLRTISENLGATVVWDNTARVATVTYGETSVMMDGMLQDGTSYIKMRDFEQLGFTVDYENYDGYKIATVSK